MVDLGEFDPTQRYPIRRAWGVTDDTTVIGWAGPLDRKTRVEDFIQAAAIMHQRHPATHFVVMGGPAAVRPEYATELSTLVHELNLQGALQFLGERSDLPRLLAGLDIFTVNDNYTWLGRAEGMPQVISEAGAAALPVIATRTIGGVGQITDGVTGLLVPHESPGAVAAAMERLYLNRGLGVRLGHALRQKVEREYSTAAVARRWEGSFAGLLEEGDDLEDSLALFGYGDGHNCPLTRVGVNF